MGRPKKTAIPEAKKRKTRAVAIRKSDPEKPATITKAALSEAEILAAFDMLGITSKLKDDNQKRLFLTVAKQNNLNPLKREIHAVSMWDADTGESKLVPVTGYEVYIDRAEETGRVQYWHTEDAGTITDQNKGIGDYRVTLIIKRRDWPKEFRWTAYYEECLLRKKDGTPNVFWKKKPHFMTAKVAIGQGFRLCMREVLRGLPYIQEEVAIAEDDYPEPKNVTEPQPKPGVVVNGEGKVIPLSRDDVEKNIARGPSEIEYARTVLQDTYHAMQRSTLFTLAELNERKEAAAKAKDNLESLRQLASCWEVELNDKKKEVEDGQPV